MFNFIQFCEEHRIPYITHGVNKKVADDCNISCPFCNQSADPDPSMHCGVNSVQGVFSCWRNPRKHKGRTLHRLIMALLRCSYFDACELLGQEIIWLKEGSFEQLSDDPHAFFEKSNEAITSFEFPDEFRTFQFKHHAEKPFVEYLAGRGFPMGSIPRLTAQYGLKWAIAGRYKHRVIIPIGLNQQWVSWTGRSIHSSTPTRYLTLSESEGAKVNIKKMIFNWDTLINEPATFVVVCEGPFDAIAVDFYGQRYGVRSTCLFSQMATMEQLAYIASLTDLYQAVIILLDDTATMLAESLKDQLPGLPVWVKTLPDGFHDPGELSHAQVWKLQQQWLNEL